jgi:hypothetical protein
MLEGGAVVGASAIAYPIDRGAPQSGSDQNEFIQCLGYYPDPYLRRRCRDRRAFEG